MALSVRSAILGLALVAGCFADASSSSGATPPLVQVPSANSTAAAGPAAPNATSLAAAKPPPPAQGRKEAPLANATAAVAAPLVAARAVANATSLVAAKPMSAQALAANVSTGAASTASVRPAAGGASSAAVAADASATHALASSAQAAAGTAPPAVASAAVSVEVAPPASARPPSLRGAGRQAEAASAAGAHPPCESQPGFHEAQQSWCRDQREPFACYKTPGSPNRAWDCHLWAGQSCSTGGVLCAWPGVQPPADPVPVPRPPTHPPVPTQPGAVTRFATWNLYVFTLAGRIGPVSDEIVRMRPEVAALPEMWHEKSAILSRLRDISGPIWAFAEGGPTERFNDADILYRSDIWQHLDSNVIPYSAGRAVNWAVLRRKSDGFQMLVAGTHPLCCRGDFETLLAVDFVTRTLRQVQERYPFPLVLMGDLNSGYYEPSQRLLREGNAHGFGRSWSIPYRFVDAWAELHPGNPNPSTINDDPVRLDYVYFQHSPGAQGGFSLVESQIWPRAAGSDHRAVSGDVALQRT